MIRYFQHFVFCIFFFPIMAFSQDLGITFGIRSDSADTDRPATSVTALNSVSLGAVMKSEMTEKLALRVAMQYTPRQYQLQSSGVSENYKFTYFELPVGILFKLSDAGGVFVGPSFGFGLDKSCGQSGVCQGVSNSVTSVQFGASFKYAPQLGIEIFYEKGVSQISPQIQQQRAVGVNLLVTFD
jgi:outer membrane receptor for monomeric catechols